MDSVYETYVDKMYHLLDPLALASVAALSQKSDYKTNQQYINIYVTT